MGDPRRAHNPAPLCAVASTLIGFWEELTAIFAVNSSQLAITAWEAGEGSTDLVDHVIGSSHQVMPGEPQHRPVQTHQSVLPAPIADEPVGTDVPSPAVDFDGDALQRERDVDQVALEWVVQFPTGDLSFPEQPNQQALSMRGGPVGRDHQQPGRLLGSPPAMIAAVRPVHRSELDPPLQRLIKQL